MRIGNQGIDALEATGGNPRHRKWDSYWERMGGAKAVLVGLFLRLLLFRLYFLRAGLCPNRQQLGSLGD